MNWQKQNDQEQTAATTTGSGVEKELGTLIILNSTNPNLLSESLKG